MTVLLTGLRRCDRVHFKSAGIQCRRKPLYISSLTRCIPAFIGNDHGYLLLVDAVMQICQLILQLIKFFRILFIGNAHGQIHFGKLGHAL